MQSCAVAGVDLVSNLTNMLSEFKLEAGKDYIKNELLVVPKKEDYYGESGNEEPQLDDPEGDDEYPTKSTTRTTFYYHPDYLGNVEYITDMDGLPYQYFWYSPWGESLKDQKAPSYDWSSPYRFNGKELDEESGLYYYGARYYNPQVSVWLSVDRLAAKYPHSSPYVFTANNPVMLIDPNGDSVNVSRFIQAHSEQWQTTKSDLEKLGGLKLSTSESGNITYEIDENAEGYSQEARDKMIDAFGDKKKHVYVTSTTGGRSVAGEDSKGNEQINLSMSQIQGFIDNNSGDLNDKTLGYGMTFLHELGHTDLGGGMSDMNLHGDNGANVKSMNRIRKQMGVDWGQRIYMPETDQNSPTGESYIPFSTNTRDAIRRGFSLPEKGWVKGSLK